MMSNGSGKKGQPTLATINKIEVTDEPRFRSPVKTAVILFLFGIIVLLGLWLRPAQLDVYKTISELQFADAALQRCVKSTAVANNWPDAGHFVSLRCNNPFGDGIQSLDGLEHLVELKEVNLAFNRITDVGALARLPQLTVVDLSHNRIRQLPVFDAALNLKRLELNYNSVVSLEWLTKQHFPVLESLSIAHNEISGITAIQSLAGLVELNARNNRIAHLAPILNLKKLVFLDAGNNLIADLSGIGMLSELRRLFLDSNRLSDLDRLELLPNIEELDLSNNALRSITQLSRMDRLHRLNLNQTGITSLSDILSLGDLQLLHISGNPDLKCDSIAMAIREYGETAVRSDRDCSAAANN